MMARNGSQSTSLRRVTLRPLPAPPPFPPHRKILNVSDRVGGHRFSLYKVRKVVGCKVERVQHMYPVYCNKNRVSSISAPYNGKAALLYRVCYVSH